MVTSPARRLTAQQPARCGRRPCCLLSWRAAGLEQGPPSAVSEVAPDRFTLPAARSPRDLLSSCSRVACRGMLSRMTGAVLEVCGGLRSGRARSRRLRRGRLDELLSWQARARGPKLHPREQPTGVISTVSPSTCFTVLGTADPVPPSLAAEAALLLSSGPVTALSIVLFALWLAGGMTPVLFVSPGLGFLPVLAWKARRACGGGAPFSRGFVALPTFAWNSPAGWPPLLCMLAGRPPDAPPLLGALAGAPACSCSMKLSGALGVPGCVPLISLGFGSLPGVA